MCNVMYTKRVSVQVYQGEDAITAFQQSILRNCLNLVVGLIEWIL